MAYQQVAGTEREKKMNNQPELVHVSLVIENNCWTCLQIGEECQTCQEERADNLTVIAHDLVDENNDIYRYAPMYTSLTKIEDQPSGHDWVGSETIKKDGSVREEFYPPITWLEDRLDSRELELGVHEKVCNACNLSFNLFLTQCPVCVEVDA